MTCAFQGEVFGTTICGYRNEPTNRLQLMDLRVFVFVNLAGLQRAQLDGRGDRSVAVVAGSFDRCDALTLPVGSIRTLVER